MNIYKNIENAYIMVITYGLPIVSLIGIYFFYFDKTKLMEPPTTYSVWSMLIITSIYAYLITKKGVIRYEI